MAPAQIHQELFGKSVPHPPTHPPGYPATHMRGLSGVVDMPLIGLGTWQYNSSLAEAAVTA